MTALQWLRRQRRGLLRAAVSVAVGGVLLFFVLRAIRTADLVETLSDISPGLAVLAAIGAFAFIVARAWRYRLLLGIERSKTGTLLAITFASWGASLVLPGPSGDAAFVLLAAGFAAGGSLLYILGGLALLAVSCGLFMKCKPWEHRED